MPKPLSRWEKSSRAAVLDIIAVRSNVIQTTNGTTYYHEWSDDNGPFARHYFARGTWHMIKATKIAKPSVTLTQDEIWTLTCAVENMRAVTDPDNTALVEARFRIAYNIEQIVKRART